MNHRGKSCWPIAQGIPNSGDLVGVQPDVRSWCSWFGCPRSGGRCGGFWVKRLANGVNGVYSSVEFENRYLDDGFFHILPRVGAFPACQARVSRLITYIIYVRTYATWKLPDQAPDYKSESMSNICRLKCAGADVRIHVRLHVKICVRWKFYRSNVRIDIRTTVRTCDPKIPKLSE